jgi:polyisoprenoid-binding protein YceI
MSAGTGTIEQAIPAGSYAVDPVHSSVGFAVRHAGATTYRSGFKRYEARLTGGEQPSLEGTVEVASIDIPEEQLKGHLLSPDFFDAERHPRLRFESSELEVAEDGSVRLRGELEIRGQRHEVTATGTFGAGGEYLDGSSRIGLSLAVGVDRRDFGLDWNAELPSGGLALEFDVEIAVELQFVKEAE